MSDFLEYGFVFDERDEELDFLKAESWVLFFGSTRRNAEFSATDDGEDGGGLLPGELDAGEVVENFEYAAARACGVVEEFVGVGRVGEFEEAFFVHKVGSVVRDELEEVAFGDRGYVEIVEEQLTEGGAWERPEVGDHAWNEVLGLVPIGLCYLKGQWYIGLIVPVHEIDQVLNVLGEVFGVDCHSITRFVLDVVGHYERKVTNILPMTRWSDTFILDDLDFESIGDGNQISWW